jgi:hypothetical protein
LYLVFAWGVSPLAFIAVAAAATRRYGLSVGVYPSFRGNRNELTIKVSLVL